MFYPCHDRLDRSFLGFNCFLEVGDAMNMYFSFLDILSYRRLIRTDSVGPSSPSLSLLSLGLHNAGSQTIYKVPRHHRELCQLPLFDVDRTWCMRTLGMSIAITLRSYVYLWNKCSLGLLLRVVQYMLQHRLIHRTRCASGVCLRCLAHE